MVMATVSKFAYHVKKRYGRTSLQPDDNDNIIKSKLTLTMAVPTFTLRRLIPNTTKASLIIDRTLFRSLSSSSSGGSHGRLAETTVKNLTPEQTADDKVAAFLAANINAEEDMELPTYGKKLDDWVVEETVEVDPLGEMNITRMSCQARCPETEEGSRASRRLRRSGLIPGVIYGGDEEKGIHFLDKAHILFVKTPMGQIYSGINRFGWTQLESRVVDLTVEDTGEVHRVTPRGLQMHPLKEKIICLNYLRYFPGRPIKIPIRAINQEESPAIKRGGYIIWQNRFIECIVEDGVPVPEHIDLECTGLERKMVLRQERLMFPDGVTVSDRVDPSKWLLGSVHARVARD